MSRLPDLKEDFIVKILPLANADITNNYVYNLVNCKSKELSPERRLLLAILADAVNAMEEGKVKNPRLYTETVRWFQDRSEVWVFSFVNICNVFNFSADQIRRHYNL